MPVPAVYKYSYLLPHLNHRCTLKQQIQSDTSTSCQHLPFLPADAAACQLQASRRTRPPNKVANRLVTWATGSGHATSAAEPLAVLAAETAHGGNKHGANGDGAGASSAHASAAATQRQDPPPGGASATTANAEAATPSATAAGSEPHPAGSSPRAAAPAASTPQGDQQP